MSNNPHFQPSEKSKPPRLIMSNTMKKVKMVKLGDRIRIVGGGTPSRKVERFYQGSIPWVTVKDLKGSFIYDSQKITHAAGETGGPMGGLIGGLMGSPIELSKRQAQLLDLIRNDSKLSKIALAEKLGINPSAVQKHLEVLKKKGVLKRIGGTRGHWEVSNHVQ